MTDAQRCRRNGWGVGTRLRAWGHSDGQVIKITAIGEDCILAKVIECKGMEVVSMEQRYYLDPGRWRRV